MGSGDLAIFKAIYQESTSIALEEEIIRGLKSIADRRSVPYRVLMRLLIVDGVRRLKSIE